MLNPKKALSPKSSLTKVSRSAYLALLAADPEQLLQDLQAFLGATTEPTLAEGWKAGKFLAEIFKTIDMSEVRSESLLFWVNWKSIADKKMVPSRDSRFCLKLRSSPQKLAGMEEARLNTIENIWNWHSMVGRLQVGVWRKSEAQEQEKANWRILRNLFSCK